MCLFLYAAPGSLSTFSGNRHSTALSRRPTVYLRSMFSRLLGAQLLSSRSWSTLIAWFLGSIKMALFDNNSVIYKRFWHIQGLWYGVVSFNSSVFVVQ